MAAIRTAAADTDKAMMEQFGYDWGCAAEGRQHVLVHQHANES